MRKALFVCVISGLLLLPSMVAAETAPVPTPTPPTETLQQRIDKRKTELKLVLTAAEKTKLTGKCKAAQVIIAKLETRVDTIRTNRTKTYSDVTTKITDIITKLKNQGADTSQLEKANTDLSAKITQFNADLQSYKQGLDDAAVMDCAKDVVGFKSIVEGARSLRVTVAKDSADIMKDVMNLKASLIAYRDNQTAEGAQ